MKVVIDSNVLFSALIRDSVTRKIILWYDKSFLFPSFIFEEAEKHKQELLKKSGLTDEEFNKLLRLILEKVAIVPSEVLIPYKEEAISLVKDIDVNDALFVACALAYPNSIIWSDDKKLKNLKKVKVLNTKEILDLMDI